ncbi:MAG: ASKHA domain-containing protein [Synoicihabitans sp.]
MPKKITINQRVGEFEIGTSLFEAGERLDISVPSSCRKQGKCRECLMEITTGMGSLSAPSPEEAHLKDNFRLSCCARITEVPGEIQAHTMRRAEIHIEDQAMNLPPEAALEKIDPAVTREGDRVLMDGQEIAIYRGPLVGLAIDIGTTTVVIRALDLESGDIIASTSLENPQRFGGTDVMSRIQFDSDHPGKLLHRTLLGYLTRAIKQLPVAPDSIFEIVVAGNPTMRDLFLGMDVSSIGQRPYRSLSEKAWRDGVADTTAVSIPARKLRLPCHPEARLYAMPVVSGHVGGDAAACLLAVAGDRTDELIAIMDIGTNTEVFMGQKDRLLAASCPAGPAFEGRAISQGMPGLAGAIEKVHIADNGETEITVIGNKAPEGICGSGLISLLAELKRTEVMNAFGRFEDGEPAFVVDEAHDISFLESDVNELAQAKGANVSGLRIVAQTYGQSLGDLDKFYLAGGFGRHLDIAAAKEIGLIPDLPDEKIVQIGNAAIEGACLALLSVSRRRDLEERVKTIEHVELETDPNFFDHFVEGCQFQPFGVETEEDQ